MITITGIDESGSVCIQETFNILSNAQKQFTKYVKELNPSVKKIALKDAMDDGEYSYNGMTLFFTR